MPNYFLELCHAGTHELEVQMVVYNIHKKKIIHAYFEAKSSVYVHLLPH